MATSAYRTWVAAGRPWDLAKPIAQLRAWANRNDIPVLGTIGNEAHLQANFPEDHTPFSFTAWPVPLPGYWVCAIDLADVRGLGSAILQLARAGSLPWLKYMNVAGKNYAYADGFRNGAPNPDHHIHLSVFSDDLNTSIGSFDPWEVSVAIAKSDVNAIWNTDDVVRAPEGYSEENTHWTAANMLRSAHLYSRVGHLGVKRLEAAVAALAKALDGIVPGVARACAEAAASVTAAEVADELEVRAKGS